MEDKMILPEKEDFREFIANTTITIGERLLQGSVLCLILLVVLGKPLQSAPFKWHMIYFILIGFPIGLIMNLGGMMIQPRRK